MIDPVEYDSYFVPSLFEPWSREVIKRAQVWKGDRVLDVACGTGIVACRIAGTGATVTAIDVDEGRLAQAKVRATEEQVPVTFQRGDGTALAFKPGSFDLVTCQQGLQFFPDRAAGAKEMRRMLASGGRAVIACWRGFEHNPVYGAIHEVAVRHFGGGYEPAFSFGDEAAMKQLLAAAKFMAVQVETVSRLVRFPDAARFVARSIESIAGNQGADPAKVPAATDEAAAAISGYVTDNVLEMVTSSLIAIGRVSAK